MAEQFGNDTPNNRLAEHLSPSAGQSIGRENQKERSTARDMADEFDTLVALLRQSAPSDTFSTESACERAVEAIRHMGRTPNPSDLGPAISTDDEAPALRALGQYQLLEKLGEGGMGTVYRALHTRLEKVVAVKVLPAGRGNDPEAIARFDREMRAVGRLDHPNIVRAFDAGEVGGSHYLVMELVDGQDLGTIVRCIGPLPVADACEAVRQAALGLDHAHSHGLVHRDVKPSNLMVSRQGEVKLLDLGLARLAEQVPAEVELTSRGQMMGTFDYMAPEQGSDSHAVDHRADVYALGATLYKLLAGRAPFAGPQYDTPMRRLTALATEAPTSIRQIRPDVPKSLARLIHRMLARDPDRRTATAAEVAELLASFTDGANLAELVACAEKAGPERAPEPDAAATQPAMSSAMEHTPHTIQISSSAVFQSGAASRGRRLAAWCGSLPPAARFALTSAAGAAALVLLAVLLTLQTSQGTLVIESDDPGVEVLVKQNGEVIDILSADRGWKVGLNDGTYDVELTRGADQMRLSNDSVTVMRSGWTVLRVTKTVSVPPPALIAPSAAPHVDGHWVRLINRMSDLCIGVNGASTEPRASLHQYEPVPGALEQHWRIESTDRPGLYRLKNRRSGLYVTLKQPRQGEGYLQRPFEDHNNEFLFSVVDIDGKWFRIVSHQSKLDAAIWGASMREGEWIIQWPFSVGATDKYWRVEPVKEEQLDEAGRWVDLLTLIDPGRDVIHGQWTRHNDSLTCDAIDTARIRLPVKTDGDFDLEIEFTASSLKDGLIFRFPVGKEPCRYWLLHSRTYSGIEFLDGRAAQNNDTTRVVSLKPKHRYKWRASVRVDDTSASIRIVLDKQTLVDWSGSMQRLRSLRNSHYKPSRHPVWLTGEDLFTLAAIDNEMIYHSIRFRAPGQDYELLRKDGSMRAEISVTAESLPDQSGIEEKKAWITAELKRLNPGYDGEARFEIEDGRIVGLDVSGEHLLDITPLHVLSSVRNLGIGRSKVADLSPLREMPLERLNCAATNVTDLTPLKGMKLRRLRCERTKVSDLSPLAGMPLEQLDVGITEVRDLSPLRGMPLLNLSCGFSQVADLSPLKGMPLARLDCGCTPIADLSPLEGMPLRELYVYGAKVSDFTPITQLPLEQLDCSFVPKRDLDAIRSITTLRMFKGQPAAEVLREAEEKLKDSGEGEKPDTVAPTN